MKNEMNEKQVLWMKTAISADDELMQQADEAARVLGLSRSGLFATTPTVRPPSLPSSVTTFGAHFGCSSMPGSSSSPSTIGCTS